MALILVLLVVLPVVLQKSLEFILLELQEQLEFLVLLLSVCRIRVRVLVLRLVLVRRRILIPGISRQRRKCRTV